jgi:hypothetical protein
MDKLDYRPGKGDGGGKRGKGRGGSTGSSRGRGGGGGGRGRGGGHRGGKFDNAKTHRSTVVFVVSFWKGLFFFLLFSSVSNFSEVGPLWSRFSNIFRLSVKWRYSL